MKCLPVSCAGLLLRLPSKSLPGETVRSRGWRVACRDVVVADKMLRNVTGRCMVRTAHYKPTVRNCATKNAGGMEYTRLGAVYITVCRLLTVIVVCKL
jgi:hypothetical protein